MDVFGEVNKSVLSEHAVANGPELTRFYMCTVSCAQEPALHRGT